MSQQTFLKCKKTGHVTWTAAGYVFWSPCPACGWNNNQSLPFSDHWEIIHLQTTKAQEKILYGTRKNPGILREWATQKEAELAAGLPLKF